ncbi:hypothetical protein AVEN_27430-1 [Araneus ventricosus]|uniref:Uncharacterized protein n=1 Tax=Araneus ventricosus TaxID=182803 RepID=A0A4Y2EGT5_ARAVE|nr:hypothetical protein AVEN_27430-1 [Araneus ventricosus]
MIHWDTTSLSPPPCCEDSRIKRFGLGPHKVEQRLSATLTSVHVTPKQWNKAVVSTDVWINNALHRSANIEASAWTNIAILIGDHNYAGTIFFSARVDLTVRRRLRGRLQVQNEILPKKLFVKGPGGR